MTPMHEEYLRHQKGLALLWLWMDQWKGVEGWTLEENEVHLSQLVSQRFCVGAPTTTTGVKGRSIFVGVQKEEAAWIKRITWSKVIVDPLTHTLWMVSAPRQSPDVMWPDLPPIALGIALNQNLVASLSGRTIDWRSVWWDEDNRAQVSSAPAGTWNMVRGTLEEKWTTNERLSLRSLKDVVLERLEGTNTYADPGYAGAAPALTEDQQEYLQPFANANAQKPIEEYYPDLFGDYISGMDAKGKKK